jgi:hypothetical protein
MKGFIFYIYPFFVLLYSQCTTFQLKEEISLAGAFRVKLDSENVGIDENGPAARTTTKLPAPRFLIVHLLFS